MTTEMTTASPPPQRRGDVLEHRLDDMGVVIDAELIWYRQQKRVGFGDGFVKLELFDKNVRLRGVAAAEHGAPVVAEEADRVCALAVAPEIGAVAIVHQRKNAAADRHPRLARVPGRLPGLAEFPDLACLLGGERLAGLVIDQRRALQIHPDLAGPFGGGA